MNPALAFAVALTTAVTGTALVGTTHAWDRHVTLTNRSHQVITEFYASNVGRSSWEEDILGTSVVPPGRSIRINLSDGTGICRFDFKTVIRTGAVIVRRGIDVCEISTYTITD